MASASQQALHKEIQVRENNLKHIFNYSSPIISAFSICLVNITFGIVEDNQ